MKYSFLLFFLLINLARADWVNDSFNTRLSDELAISAYKCQGDEITRDFKCSADEWLMIVDDVNRCRNGYCTEIAVLPIIVRLQHSYDSFYTIIPTIPVSAEVRWILRRHWVKFYSNGEGEVISKR